MPPKKDPVFEYIDTLIVDQTRLDRIVHDLSGLVDNLEQHSNHMFGMLNDLQNRIQQLEFEVIKLSQAGYGGEYGAAPAA